jgi:hypothetical protein
MFDRICNNNSITHLLTAPYSPTTTGKVERLHKTMREGFFAENDRVHETIEEAQVALDAWVHEYNVDRPHQSLGDRPPAERFALAGVRAADEDDDEPDEAPTGPRPAGVSRWVDQRGSISVSSQRYRVGPTFAGEPVEVVVRDGLVEILHAGVLVATHAERGRARSGPARQLRERGARPPSAGIAVKRIVDGAGSVSFAGTSYRAGMAWARKQVDVAIVAGSVQVSSNGKVIRVHAIRHDRSKEHGAFSMPSGKPRKTRVA